MAKISALTIYPLKSAKGIALNSLRLKSRGPRFDRDWMVINANNRFLSQRQHPSMCLIGTTLSAGKLTLTAPNKKPLTIDSQNTLNKQNVVVWSDTVSAVDCGDHAAEWISNFLGIECRIVHMPSETQRLVDKDLSLIHI